MEDTPGVGRKPWCKRHTFAFREKATGARLKHGMFGSCRVVVVSFFKKKLGGNDIE
jgi:hypothetical protein